MKILLGIFLILSISMSPVPEQMTDHHQCVSSGEISCIVDTPYVCPPGYIDGCISNETRTHQCLPDENLAPTCDLEISINCPDNFEDGCLTGDTDYHLCVPRKGPLCGQGKTLTCPSGFDDSCLR